MTGRKCDIDLVNKSGKTIPLDIQTINSCLELLAQHENCTCTLLEVVYVDENGIVEINKEYLDRDYITDVISFRYDDNSDRTHIEGTLFCCAPRIYEQSLEFKTDPEQEFRRILLHGLLHLCGYTDYRDQDKQEMTERENFYLRLLKD